MSDARHPKKYPPGPRLPMSSAWKSHVLEILARNKVADREPRHMTELALMIKADPTGVNKALTTDRPSSKYVRAICDLLKIDEPMMDRPIVKDEIEELAFLIRSLPPARRRQVLKVLRAMVSDVD